MVTEDEAGLRVDELLATRLALGRRAAVRIAARALHSGRRARKGDRVRAGDVIELPASEDAEPLPAGGAPHIVRVTRDVVVLDKPAGLASVRVAGSARASAADWLARAFPECAAVGPAGECGLAHRLDTGTSGLLLAARGDHAYRALRAQFDRHAIEKSYLALVAGDVAAPFEVAVAIGQHPKSRRRMRAVEASGRSTVRYAARPAATRVEPVELLGGTTIVRAVTTTGARHQIRVHLAHAGHPLVADALYGGTPRPGIARYFLHAERIRWTDPATGEPADDSAPEPETWAEIRRALSAERPTAPP